jgi:hypothetical protein
MRVGSWALTERAWWFAMLPGTLSGCFLSTQSTLPGPNTGMSQKYLFGDDRVPCRPACILCALLFKNSTISSAF